MPSFNMIPSPPTIQPLAARRWYALARPPSPWLHEEVGSRMSERLDLIRLKPKRWVHWEPTLGGLLADEALRRKYPHSECFYSQLESDTPYPRKQFVAPSEMSSSFLRKLTNQFRWNAAPSARVIGGSAPDEGVDMVWANLLLHSAPDPHELMAKWLTSLVVGGFAMFSALGPDTLHELRDAYAQAGWGPIGSQLTDMHDWGDMAVAQGFAEPVMDMEHITLTYATAEALLLDLRLMGRNFHPSRPHGLKGKAYRLALLDLIDSKLRSNNHGGRLALTFEVIYGHAIKPQPRMAVSAKSSVSLRDMRAMLRKPTPNASP